MSDLNTKSGFWKGVTTAILVLGGLWTLIQVYDYFIVKEAYLEAKGEVNDFSMPSQIEKIIRESNGRVSIEDIEKNLPADSKGKEEIAISIANYVNEFREQTADRVGLKKDQLLGLSNIDSLYFITIKNGGPKVANDVKVNLPIRGLYKYISPQETRPDFFDKTIKLGDFQPNETKQIQVWRIMDFQRSGYILRGRFRGDKDEIATVTHSNGFSEIEFPRKVFGLLAWFDDNWYPLSGILVLVLLLIPAVSLSLAAAKKSSHTEVETNTDSQPSSKLDKGDSDQNKIDNTKRARVKK